MINKILELIFPNICGFCGKIDKNSLCVKCKNKLHKISKAKIIKYHDKNFKYLAYLFEYSGIVRELIIKYKFHNQSYLYKTFSKIITKNEKLCRFIKKYDIIIPVPIHKKRNRERGYNQSELLGAEIAKTLQLPIEIDILLKIKNNTAQSTLTKEERITNAKNVYKVQNTSKIKNKNILIIDDIYTTGSTANECSRMLKQAGASTVAVLAIAKD